MAHPWGPFDIHGYTLSGVEYDSGQCWGECESPDGRMLWSARGYYRQEVIDALTEAAFRDWRKKDERVSV